MIEKKIRQLRGKEPQAEFGARFGISRNTVMRYESGERKPDSDFVAALCREYKVEANWLLLEDQETSGSDSPSKNNMTAPSMPSDKLGLGESVELLAKIYNSGNTVLIRAIAANLHAFSEAVDNKALAQKAIDMMDEMNKRMLAMEKGLAMLKEENEELKKRAPAKDQQQATG